MKNVLIINPYYLPGFRSGGPQQTVQNICRQYNSCSNIFLLTLNHDFGENQVYDFPTEKWLKLYGINIMYLSDKDFGIKAFKHFYTEFDTIYACGLFCKSTYEMILVNWLHQGKKEVYVAPMGVFSKNALTIKRKKKEFFIKTFSTIGAFRKIIWSFSSDDEYTETKEAIGTSNISKYIIAEDLPRSVDFDLMKKNIKNKGEELKIIFLSRIAQKKNLLYAIEILNDQFESDIRFDIYGPKEDEQYWQLCQEAMGKLPPNIHGNYCGCIKPEESEAVFSRYDVFLFPTLGENYGHVIYEALAAGCNPVISDTTPWKDLDEKQCGRVVALDDIEGFRNAIKRYINMTNQEIMAQKKNAIEYAEEKYKTAIADSGYKHVFCDH